MANAYSILREYKEHVEPFDFNLLTKALEYKQGKFDANVEKVQAQIDQFASIDLLRDVDKEYFRKRLGAVVDYVNGAGQLDLSSTGVTRAISSQLREALDENVLTAVSSTQQARQLVAQINEIKTKQRELYAPQNEYVATKGLNEYISSTDIGRSYTGGSYTPYTDVTKKLDEYMDNLDKYADVQKIQTKEGAYFVTRESKIVTEQQVRTIAEGFLSAQDRNQLRIDAEFNWNRMEPESLKQAFRSYGESKLAELEASVKHYDYRGQAEQASQMKQLRDQFKTNHDKALLDGDTMSMALTLQKENLFGALSEKFAFTHIERTYDVDQYELELFKHNLKNKASNEGLIYHNSEFSEEQKTKMSEANETSMMKYKKERDNALNNWFSNLGDETLGSIKADYGVSDLSELNEEQKFKAFKEHAVDNQTSKEQYQAIMAAHKNYETHTALYDQELKQTRTQLDSEFQSALYHDISTGLSSQKAWLDGSWVNVKDYLENNGVNLESEETFRESMKTEGGRAIVNKLKANALAADFSNKFYASLSGRYMSDNTVGLKEQDALKFQELVNTIYPNKEFDINKYNLTPRGIIGGSAPEAALKMLGSPLIKVLGMSESLSAAPFNLSTEMLRKDFPEVVDILENTNSRTNKRMFEGSVVDRSLGHGSTGTFVSSYNDKFSKVRNEKAFELAQSQLQLKDVVLPAKSSAATYMYNWASTRLEGGTKFALDPNSPMELRRVSPTEVAIVQAGTMGKGEDKFVTVQEYGQNIPINILPPEVQAIIKVEPYKMRYDAKLGLKTSNTAQFYKSTDSKIKDVHENLDFVYDQTELSNVAPLDVIKRTTSRSESLRMLQETFGSGEKLWGTPEQPSELRQLVNAVMSQPYTVTASPSKNGQYWTIDTYKGTNTGNRSESIIDSYKYDNPNLGGTADVIEHAPSYYMVGLLGKAIFEYQNKESSEPILFNQLKSLYLVTNDARQQ